MSVMDRSEQKVALPRVGIEAMWNQVQRGFALEDQMLWRNLAMFTLREIAGWTFEQIGVVFGLHRGHVLRCIQQTKQMLRQEFHNNPLASDAWDRLTDPDVETLDEAPRQMPEWECDPGDRTPKSGGRTRKEPEKSHRKVSSK